MVALATPLEILAARSDGGTGDPSVDLARAQAAAKIAEYGSIDRWPTLMLEPERYARCTCGHSRAAFGNGAAYGHRLIGTDRGSCKTKGCLCKMFVADRGKAAK